MRRGQRRDGWYRDDLPSASLFVKCLMCCFGGLVGAAFGFFIGALGLRSAGAGDEGSSIFNPLTICAGVGALFGLGYVFWILVGEAGNSDEE